MIEARQSRQDSLMIGPLDRTINTQRNAETWLARVCGEGWKKGGIRGF